MNDVEVEVRFFVSESNYRARDHLLNFIVVHIVPYRWHPFCVAVLCCAPTRWLSKRITQKAFRCWICILSPSRRFPRHQCGDLFFGQANMQEENGSKQGAQLLIQKEYRCT